MKHCSWMISLLSLLVLIPAIPGAKAQDDSYVKILQMNDTKERADAIISLEDSLSDGTQIASCKSIGEGNYGAVKLTYKNGDEAVFKTNDPTDENGWARYQHEAAAYQVAKQFGIDQVPPTVILEIPDDAFAQLHKQGKLDEACFAMYQLRKKHNLPLRGSAQYFIKGASNYPWQHDFPKPGILKLFDFLTFNCDRPGNKNLIQKGGVPFFIDNGFAFLSKEQLNAIKDTKDDEEELAKLRKLRDATSNPGKIGEIQRFINSLKIEIENNSNFCAYLLDLEKNPKPLCDLFTGDQFLEIQSVIASLTVENMDRLLSQKQLEDMGRRADFLAGKCITKPKVFIGLTALRHLRAEEVICPHHLDGYQENFPQVNRLIQESGKIVKVTN